MSVVIPARDATRTLDRVLAGVGRELAEAELIVVDDGSTDATAEVARRRGSRVLSLHACGSAGGARNRGWAVAGRERVVFLDSDAIPAPGWGAGVERAIREYPDAIVGCASSFSPTGAWGWVAHLEVETPYLPVGPPRRVPFVSTYCMIVPPGLEIRFDESYGAEDAIFCVDAVEQGIPIVFDPRFHAVHDHGRDSFADLRKQQKRLVYGLARVRPVQLEGRHKRVLSHVPVHYFLLARLPIIHRRLRNFPALRRRFLRVLPQMIVGEWSMGVAALRYAIMQPRLRTPASGPNGRPD